MRALPLTERSSRDPVALDLLPAAALVDRFLDETEAAVRALRPLRARLARAVELVADRLRRGGRLVLAGAGTSGRLAVLEAAECPPTFGTRPGQVLGLIAGGARALRRAVEGAEDRAADGRRAVAAAGFAADDVLVALSASGRTPYALAALREARRRGGVTLAVTCAPGSALAREADLALVAAVGPEVLAGSTRMKSGTAQKAILNLITTGAFARTGRVLGHLMVGVRPGSAKLRARAARIVAEAGGLPLRAAAALLRRAAGDVRVALVMRRRAVSARGARALLAGADLRSLLEGPA